MSAQTQQSELIIGLFGFGVVGEALYQVLSQTPTLNARVKKVCIKHPEKTRNAPADLFTTDPAQLLKDPGINVIIELIDDAAAAFQIVSAALRSKKSVISANKKMIAENLAQLLDLQTTHDVPFLYEAACCASIPVIRNLEEYYDNDLLQGISGIVNGSTNYILTRISENGLSFDDALLEAQVAGFAESDPTLDVNGTDAANKLSILLTHAYGILAEPQSLIYTGIQQLHGQDAVFAKEKGFQLKLVAQARKLENGSIAAFVLPQFVDNNSQLHSVRNEYNGLIIESGLADKQFFYGKGAGGFPTASAVLSDLSALRYHYRYEYKKLKYPAESHLSDDFSIKVCVSFRSLLQVPHERFEKILAWSSNEHRCHITGVLRFRELVRNNWWKQAGVSVIVYPDGIIESETGDQGGGSVVREIEFTEQYSTIP